AYDGGKYKNGTNIIDIFHDVKVLPNGMCVCVGESGDSTDNISKFFVVYLDTAGKVLKQKLLIGGGNGCRAYSVAFAKNGDLVIGGNKTGKPFLVRTDSLLNIKWATWYYDSIQGKSMLSTTSATLNSVCATPRNTFMCAAGDPYPYPALGGHNYAALVEFDSIGQVVRVKEWNNVSGFNINGFDVEEVPFDSGFLLCGNTGLVYTNKSAAPHYQKQYGFQLDLVGSELAEVNRAKLLRDGSLFVAGRAYELACWTKYKKFYYDAWWSPAKISNGLNLKWDTAGLSGQDERILDFTQLNNGNIVLVGEAPMHNTTSTQMLICITDSLGKTLWTSTFQFPNSINSTEPYSIVATPDGGFTVVGTGGGVTGDAIAMHFVSKPVAVVADRNFTSKSVDPFKITFTGKKLIISGNAIAKNFNEVSLYTIAGKRIALKAAGKRNSAAAFDVSQLSSGTYLVKVNASPRMETKIVVIGR
ncbi:MAG: T9SS type A sorting domain-containing protein, partial [Chitinivibrionales bacterium]|nr:T9SS type A sorting domain-containing protein [Chitinivibrionales bacterium]